MKTKSIAPYISLFVVCLLIFGVIKYINIINMYKIDSFEINGNQFIDNDEIKTIVNKTIQNSSYNLDINKIQNSINEHTFINKSKVYSVLPSKIIITVKEIIPIAIYENNSNIFFLDHKLNKVQANNKSINYYSVPLVSSIDNKIDYECISNILLTIKNKNKKFYKSINELIVHEDIILLKIKNGTKIYLDKDKELNNTVKLLSFLTTIKNNKKISDYKYVDLTIPKQIIVKENKKI